MNAMDVLARISAAQNSEVWKGTIQSQHNYRGDATVVVAAAELPSLVDFIVADEQLQLNVLLDITAADYLPRDPRFEVVYHFLNYETSLRLRIKVQLNEGQAVPSMTSRFKGANWMEREVWDLYGIAFADHPDLRRILLYPEFAGHPLRKDYEKEHQQPRVELRPYRHWKEAPPEGVR